MLLFIWMFKSKSVCEMYKGDGGAQLQFRRTRLVRIYLYIEFVFCLLAPGMIVCDWSKLKKFHSYFFFHKLFWSIQMEKLATLIKFFINLKSLFTEKRWQYWKQQNRWNRQNIYVFSSVGPVTVYGQIGSPYTRKVEAVLRLMIIFIIILITYLKMIKRKNCNIINNTKELRI